MAYWASRDVSSASKLNLRSLNPNASFHVFYPMQIVCILYAGRISADLAVVLRQFVLIREGIFLNEEKSGGFCLCRVAITAGRFPYWGLFRSRENSENMKTEKC